MAISQEIQALVQARMSRPHDYLGMHPRRGGGVVCRAFLKGATACDIVEPDAPDAPPVPMKRLTPEGVYQTVIPGRAGVFKYQLRATYAGGVIRQFYDPYCFLPTLSEQDLYLFNEGTELCAYEKLGAHVRDLGGVTGVSFAVWAPSAARVSVVGNFNQWDGRYHPMRSMGASGVWELFIPGLPEGELYKFEIRDAHGTVRLKTDPYGTYFEAPPGNAAIVYNTRKFEWRDAEWLRRRAAQAANPDRAMSIYEVHLGSWRRVPEDGDRPLTYRELAPALADYVSDLGFTHVEIMPIAEHPFDGSWGYQVTGFFAPTHRYGTPEDFAWFVDYLHGRGIGVLLDWVPAHFPRDSFALAEFDGTHLYEHADPRQGAHMDWGTLIFNYGRNEVRCFLVANALAWFDRYHVDGLRVDAVASMLYLDYSRKAGEWIPNRYGGRENLEAIDFLRRVNEVVHRQFPGVATIAEESTSFPQVTKSPAEGGLGFDYKWNMGWMHDTLRYFSKEPIHRRHHHNDLTFGMLYQYAENFISVFSHDEVVHGKASLLFKMGAWHIHDKAAHLRSLYAHMWAYPGKKLVFMGGEFAQSGEWRHDAALDWNLREYLDHEGVRLLLRDLNRLYTSDPVFHANDFNPRGFRWVSCLDANANLIAYLRFAAAEDTFYLVVGHYAGAPRRGYRIGVPRPGRWRELINTDSQYYGGSGAGNEGERHAEAVAADGFPQSVVLTLPAATTLIFQWTREKPADETNPPSPASAEAEKPAATLSPDPSPTPPPE